MQVQLGNIPSMLTWINRVTLCTMGFGSTDTSFQRDEHQRTTSWGAITNYLYYIAVAVNSFLEVGSGHSDRGARPMALSEMLLLWMHA